VKGTCHWKPDGKGAGHWLVSWRGEDGTLNAGTMADRGTRGGAETAVSTVLGGRKVKLSDLLGETGGHWYEWEAKP
jgi:hypothetical protein